MEEILIVDDESDIRELLSDILEDEGYATRTADTANGAMAELNEKLPSLCILDIWLKDSDLDGIDILKWIKKHNPEVPCVIISGHGNIEIAVAAVKQGAYDFIEKPFNIDQLLVVVKRALEAASLRRENIALKSSTEISSSKMIGSSAAMKVLSAQLEKIAKSNSRVLLSGPSGSGKEVAAKFIHNNSERAKAPFVTVTCAASEPDRVEELLFGWIDPTGEVQKGLFEQADGGTLYFDEIADMPLASQSKILRALIDQSFSRIGSTEKIKVDLRVISSTAKDLQNEIRLGNFREELYHRLNVMPVQVPALEERMDDIRSLAEYFIDEISSQQRLTPRKLSDDALAILQIQQWPGNIRQLRNVIERALILGGDSREITADEITETTPAKNGGSPNIATNFAAMPLREARELFEREYLLNQIRRFGGNISKTANFVGMERSALHRKLKSLGVATNDRYLKNEEAMV